MAKSISVKGLTGFSIEATDGGIGTMEQVFFDDERRVVRYVIVDTGKELGDRRVLISPLSVVAIDEAEKRVRVNLGRQHVQASPDIDAQKPVSRQKELEYNRYYGLPVYWGGAQLWGSEMSPSLLLTLPERGEEESDTEGASDVHLRSSREVLRYKVVGSDGASARLDDLLFDERSWAIRTLVVRVRRGLRVNRFEVDADRIAEIDWASRTVSLSAPLLPPAPPKA